MTLPLSCAVPAKPDEAYERFTRLVRAQLGVPVAMVSFVWAQGQVLPGAVGLPEPWMSTRQTPLSHSFCQHVITSRAPLVIRDAREDPLVAHNLAIPDLGVIAYAGMPLVDAAGDIVGSLCAIDTEPHDWTGDDLAVLEDLAGACSAQVQLRAAQETALASGARARADAVLRRTLLALSEALAATSTAEDVARAVHTVAATGLGATWAGVLVPEAHRPGTLRHVAGSVLPGLDGGTPRVVPRGADLPSAAAALDGVPRFYADRAQLAADVPAPDIAAMLPPDAAGAIVPLNTPGRPPGVLVLGWDQPVDLTGDVRGVVLALARYTAQALERARLLRDRRDVVTTLQESMLTHLPTWEHAQMASYYLPSGQDEKVGGDWYDAVVTRSGDLVVTIGDVAGHDIAAAAAMGQLRATTRAFVWDHDEAPSAVLSRLDAADAGLGLSTTASAVLARISHARADGTAPVAAGPRLLTWTNAGHPPPLLVAADGTVEVLMTTNDLLLGVQPGRPRTDHRRPFRSGDTLLLYTDGLVERRTRPLSTGLGELTEWMCRHHRLDVEELVRTCTHDLAGHEPPDDVAVLAVRWPTG